jgi:hypothetical protein
LAVGLRLGERSAGDGPIQGYAHDQYQPFQPIRFLDLALVQAESPAFEIGKHRLDAPAHTVVKDSVFAGLGIHGDDPRLLVAALVQNADIGGDAAAGEFG